MENNWTAKADKLAREFIILQIENNDYYYIIRKAYKKDKNCVNDILSCWEDDGCHSIYKIMDRIEDYMAENYVDDINEVVSADDFYIED